MVESQKSLQTMPPREADVVIVGAGIIGLATARELALRHEGIRIAVLERESAIASHQTGRSSGVIHAGIYYAPGSLKARLCVQGARELYEFCAERGIPAQRGGKLIVATRPEELPRLDELERRGTANGVPGLAMLEEDEIAAVEPHARGIQALHSPATGTVDFRAVAQAFADDVVAAGGTVSTSCEVLAIRDEDAGVAVRHAAGSTVATSRRELRWSLVGPACGGGRRSRGSADRPLPWRLPPPAPRAGVPRSLEHLPGARP